MHLTKTRFQGGVPEIFGLNYQDVGRQAGDNWDGCEALTTLGTPSFEANPKSWPWKNLCFSGVALFGTSRHHALIKRSFFISPVSLVEAHALVNCADYWAVNFRDVHQIQSLIRNRNRWKKLKFLKKDWFVNCAPCLRRKNEVWKTCSLQTSSSPNTYHQRMNEKHWLYGVILTSSVRVLI